MGDRTSNTNAPRNGYQGNAGSTGAPKADGSQAERKRGELYLNVGVTGADGMFYPLPLGLNIDLMNPTPNKNGNPIFAAQNKLLADLQALGFNLDKGGAQQINLVVELRRRADDVEAAPVVENLLPSLSSLIVGNPSLRASARNQEILAPAGEVKTFSH